MEVSYDKIFIVEQLKTWLQFLPFTVGKASSLMYINEKCDTVQDSIAYVKVTTEKFGVSFFSFEILS